MVCRLGLAVGESFAELQTFSSDSASVKTRWYLPKKSLADGLKESLREINEKTPFKKIEISVATRASQRSLDRGHGKAPAFLVTSGFEKWLELQQPLLSPMFSPRGTRAALKSDSDFVFAINERLDANGEVIAPLSLEELEFLAAKFSLLKIQDVAIAFLHSKKNPDHEKRAANFFKEKGFRVSMSHEQTADQAPFDEATRWRMAIENAYTEAAVCEERAQIESALESFGVEVHKQVWTAEGLKEWSHYSSTTSWEGMERALRTTLSQEPTLHLGLDRFWLALPGEPIKELSVRPTQLIRHGLWPFPAFAREYSSYEPGPMLFGRSHQLAALDILFVEDKLKAIEGFSNLISEKSKARILETLFTLAKSPSMSAQKRAPDANAVADDLEQAFIEQLVSETLMETDSNKIRLTGALAPTLAPILKKRFGTRFKATLSEKAAYAESLAAAEVKL